MKIELDLTPEEYQAVKNVLDKMVHSRRSAPLHDKKWIKCNGCMINTETGCIINLISNRPF